MSVMVKSAFRPPPLTGLHSASMPMRCFGDRRHRYPWLMLNRVNISGWDVPSGILPSTSNGSAIYVLPALKDSEGRPAYRFESMLILKGAASDGVKLEYALPPGERRFVDHFSADVSALEIWLAVSGPITDIFLFGLGYAVNALLRRRGSSPEDAQTTPLKLRIAQFDLRTGKVEGLEAEGMAGDVIEAVRELKGNQ